MDAAAGAIAESRSLLRTMLSQCTYWQQFGGANYSESQALARIYLDGPPLTGDIAGSPDLLPYAVISRGDRGVRWTKTASNTWSVSGHLIVELYRKPAAIDDEDPGAQERAYENDVARIVSAPTGGSGLLQLSRNGSGLDIFDIVEDGPYRADGELITIVGDAWIYYLGVEWGTRG